MTVELAVLHLRLDSGGDLDKSELDDLTRRLLAELRRSEVESADLPSSPSDVPAGAKAGDVVSTGSILVAVLPVTIPAVVGLVRDWLGRQNNKTIRITVNEEKVEAQIELSGDVDSQEWSVVVKQVNDLVAAVSGTSR